MLADHLGPLADEVRRFEESISNIMSDTASMAQQKGGDFEVQNVLRSLARRGASLAEHARHESAPLVCPVVGPV